MARIRYDVSIFLNVPFDEEYKPIFETLIFAVHDCGFVARSTLESDDATEVRIQKLYQLIAESKYGIHDISRTGLDEKNHLPRFNMPLELGVFLGAKRFGGARHRNKRALVLDREPYRYQKFCSDIAGQDIQTHYNRKREAIRCVRNWLHRGPEVTGRILPSADYIYERYQKFRRQLPKLCNKFGLKAKDLQFNDYTALIYAWLNANPRWDDKRVKLNKDSKMPVLAQRLFNENMFSGRVDDF